MTTVTLEQLAAQGITVVPSAAPATPVFSTPATPVAAPLAASGKNEKTGWSRLVGCFFNLEGIDSPSVQAYRLAPNWPSVGELLASKQWMAARPTDGRRGNHYVLVYQMPEADAHQLADVLEANLPAKPKSQRSTASRRSFSQPSNNAASGVDEATLARIVAGAVSQQLQAYGLVDAAPPATPVAPAPGFTIATPATPVGQVYRPGDVIPVEIDGVAVARQISTDGKRLNATIV